MIVMKFGGASLANAELVQHAAGLIAQYSEGKAAAVVVSAAAGVTDKLFSLVAHLAQKDSQAALQSLDALANQHIEVLHQFNPSPEVSLMVKSILSELETEICELSKRPLQPADIDRLVSMGERLNAPIVAEAVRHKGLKSTTIDAADIFVTTSEFGDATLLPKPSRAKTKYILEPLLEAGIIPVVTGYYGATPDGQIATFNRGGSDYSAAWLAALLEAESVIFWKDVPGVFTADPRKEGDARLYQTISYQQAVELAENGAKIFHPRAIPILEENGIPAYVKSAPQSELPGTKISYEPTSYY